MEIAINLEISLSRILTKGRLRIFPPHAIEDKYIIKNPARGALMPGKASSSGERCMYVVGRVKKGVLVEIHPFHMKEVL